MKVGIAGLMLASVTLTLVGCASSTDSTVQINTKSTTQASEAVSDVKYSTVNVDSDFTPPTGRPLNPPPASAGERRLLLAYSDDGLTFTPTGEVLTDQGNVPDLIVEPNGTIRVYYIGQNIEIGKEENTVMASSDDQGATWTFHKLTYLNFPQPRDPSDPDIVQLADGSYRMYYTSSLQGGGLGILYATSLDGYTFTYQGESLEGSANLIDSTTFFYNGLWHMYVLQDKVEGQLHATSTDGLTFTLTSPPQLKLPLNRYIASNPIVTDDQVRMFAFNGPEKNIRSFTSTDVVNWTSSEIALAGDDAATLETGYIQDLSVAKLTDGRYLMVYVSALPN